MTTITDKTTEPLVLVSQMFEDPEGKLDEINQEWALANRFFYYL